MAAVCPLDDYEVTDWYVPVRPAPRPAQAVYRRRRVVVLAVATVVAVLLGVRLGSALGSVPASAPERLPVPATYTVRPGDTLWSIATTLQPEGDVRALVSRLIAANGGDTIRVGQVLAVPDG